MGWNNGRVLMIFCIVAALIRCFSREKKSCGGAEWYKETYTLYLFRRFTISYYELNDLWKGMVSQQIYINWRPKWETEETDGRI
jgi:hypothetical protein